MFVPNIMLYRLYSTGETSFSLMNKLSRSQLELQQACHCVDNAIRDNRK